MRREEQGGVRREEQGGVRREVRPSALVDDPTLRRSLACFILLELCDSLTTVTGLVSGLSEVNPVATRMLHRFGLVGLLLEKVPVVVLVAIAAVVLPRRLAVTVILAASTLVALVLVSNGALLLTTR